MLDILLAYKRGEIAQKKYDFLHHRLNFDLFIIIYEFVINKSVDFFPLFHQNFYPRAKR